MRIQRKCISLSIYFDGICIHVIDLKFHSIYFALRKAVARQFEKRNEKLHYREMKRNERSLFKLNQIGLEMKYCNANRMKKDIRR